MVKVPVTTACLAAALAVLLSMFLIYMARPNSVIAKVNITIEIEAEIPSGAPDNVVRTVTENCRTLKFDNSGFEES